MYGEQDPFDTKLSTLADYIEGKAPAPYAFSLQPREVIRDQLVLAMAGRVDDNRLMRARSFPDPTDKRAEVAFWAMLGAGDIPVTVDEQRLLRCLAVSGVAGDRRFRLLAPGENLPMYTFTADPPAPPALDATVTFHELDNVQRVVRAYRRSANAAVHQPPTWVYILEVDPPDNLNYTQDQVLRPAPEGPGPHPPWCLVEVVARHQVLPRYHRDALAAGRLVWQYGDDPPPFRREAPVDFDLGRAVAMVAARRAGWTMRGLTVEDRRHAPFEFAFDLRRGELGVELSLFADGGAQIDWGLTTSPVTGATPGTCATCALDYVSVDPIFRLDDLLDEITAELMMADVDRI